VEKKNTYKKYAFFFFFFFFLLLVSLFLFSSFQNSLLFEKPKSPLCFLLSLFYLIIV
ncbi:uncharacterized protein BYT42DRAFT_531230, partial [Radiomyces spectabilis]|uniref:uncharacterized protein n=1 Tax=Radiomyces spectabilis TaxID=64574 RepID=UPI00221EBF62